MIEKKKLEPSKKQKAQFVKGFWWGKKEHLFEKYTTKLLIMGLVAQFLGLFYMLFLESKELTVSVISIGIGYGFFVLALATRGIAGFAHKREKFYNDKLRYGRWKKNK